MPTDGWGSSSMLYAVVEGLCGIEDLEHSYRRVRCSPRWVAALEDEASVEVGYAASGARFGYDYVHNASSRTMTLRFEGEAEVSLHLLLPPATRPEAVVWDGEAADLEVATVEDSAYADARGDVRSGTTVEVRYVST